MSQTSDIQKDALQRLLTISAYINDRNTGKLRKQPENSQAFAARIESKWGYVTVQKNGFIDTVTKTAAILWGAKGI